MYLEIDLIKQNEFKITEALLILFLLRFLRKIEEAKSQEIIKILF